MRSLGHGVSDLRSEGAVPRMDLSLTVAYIINKNGDSLVESRTSANSTTTIDSFIYGAAGTKVSLTNTNINDTMDRCQSSQTPYLEARSTTHSLSAHIKNCLRTSTPSRISTNERYHSTSLALLLPASQLQRRCSPRKIRVLPRGLSDSTDP